MTYLRHKFRPLGQVQSLSLSVYNDTRGRFSHVNSMLFGLQILLINIARIDLILSNLPIVESVRDLSIAPFREAIVSPYLAPRTYMTPAATPSGFGHPGWL